MARYLLITAVGEDRPGLVAGITEALLESGYNVEDSSMTRLRHDFAMMLLVGIPRNDPIEPLLARLDAAAERTGLTVTTRELTADQAKRAEPEAVVFHINVYGGDRPGIVHGIAQTIAAHQANITDLRTTVAGTPDKPIYVMLVEVAAPPQTDPRAFSSALVQAGERMDVDVTVQLLDAAAL